MILPARWGTLLRLLGAAGITLGLGAALSACGDSGTALAQQACTHVNRSIALFKESGLPANAADAAGLQQKAYIQLRDALPIAAQAAFHDGQWQALMTTISESNRVPEQTLISALGAQCQSADSSVDGQPPPPSNIPPPTATGS